MPGMVIAIIPERFPQGEVALDIIEGKLFLLFDLWERPSANQEIVHAQDQRSVPPSLLARVGTAGHRPCLFHQPEHRS